jgi:hypothetical protein
MGISSSSSERKRIWENGGLRQLHDAIRTTAFSDGVFMFFILFHSGWDVRWIYPQFAGTNEPHLPAGFVWLDRLE